MFPACVALTQESAQSQDSSKNFSLGPSPFEPRVPPEAAREPPKHSPNAIDLKVELLDRVLLAIRAVEGLTGELEKGGGCRSVAATLAPGEGDVTAQSGLGQ